MIFPGPQMQARHVLDADFSVHGVVPRYQKSLVDPGDMDGFSL